MNPLNGKIWLARQIIESELWQDKPAEWLKIWIYILIKVNFADQKRFKRGSNFFRWSFDSFHLPGVSEYQWHSCIEWLKQATQITTQKTTRGNIITVVNYAKYQDIENYKPTQKPTRQPKQNRHTTDTIIEEYNKDNNTLTTNVVSVETPSQKAKVFFLDKDKQDQVVQKLVAKGLNQEMITREITKFVHYWTEKNKTGTKERWQLQETFELDRRLSTWLNNVRQTNRAQEPKGIRL